MVAPKIRKGDPIKVYKPTNRKKWGLLILKEELFM
jgi:hypothetical protein